MPTGAAPPGLWAGQTLHAVCLASLLMLAWVAWWLLGEPFPGAYWSAIAVPVAHQVFVWLTWRLELRSGATGKTIGFRAYLVVFFVLLIGRPVAIVALAWLDRASLGLPMLPRVIAALVLVLPAIYALYSVKRYFGFLRAAGADHFDPRYRDMPLVEDGIFRFTNNGMYGYAFLLFWAIAVGFDSLAALVAAAFSHAYIWVHFLATEKPDMNYLYGAAGKP
jgi:Phospholipid methyltransferase